MYVITSSEFFNPYYIFKSSPADRVVDLATMSTYRNERTKCFVQGVGTGRSARVMEHA